MVVSLGSRARRRGSRLEPRAGPDPDPRGDRAEVGPGRGAYGRFCALMAKLAEVIDPPADSPERRGPGLEGWMVPVPPRLPVAPSLEYIERIYDDGKHGDLSREP